MAAARERFRWRAALGALFLSLAACSAGSGDVIAPAGRERAEALAQIWAAHEGAGDRTLSPENDLSLGETGISYDPRQDALFGRVWINMARTQDAPPERMAAYRRMEAALNDPAIGGMFDRAGGYFVLNVEREGFFLVRRFPLQMTTPETLVRDMERLQSVAGVWTTDWFFKVAMIMHGNEKPPKEPVTLAR